MNNTTAHKTGDIVTLKVIGGRNDCRTIMQTRPNGYRLSNGAFVDRNFCGACYTGLAK